MHGYHVEMIEERDGALVARVLFASADGRTERKELAWPLETKRRDLEIALADRHAKWVAEGVKPVEIHEAMDLVGTDVELPA